MSCGFSLQASSNRIKALIRGNQSKIFPTPCLRGWANPHLHQRLLVRGTDHLFLQRCTRARGLVGFARTRDCHGRRWFYRSRPWLPFRLHQIPMGPAPPIYILKHHPICSFFLLVVDRRSERIATGIVRPITDTHHRRPRRLDLLPSSARSTRCRNQQGLRTA